MHEDETRSPAACPVTDNQVNTLAQHYLDQVISMKGIHEFDGSTPNYYEILRLAEHTTTDDIRNAYRKRPRKDHSAQVKEPTSIERTQIINAAYEVLSDPKRRALYDAFLKKRAQANARAERLRKREGRKHQEKTQVRKGQDTDLPQDLGYADDASSSNAKTASKRAERLRKRKEHKCRKEAKQARERRKIDLPQRPGHADDASSSNAKEVSERVERLRKREERKLQKRGTQTRKGQDTALLPCPRYADDASSSNAKEVSERAERLHNREERKRQKEETQVQEGQNTDLPPRSECASDPSSSNVKEVSERVERLRKRRGRKRRQEETQARKGQNTANLRPCPGYADDASSSKVKAARNRAERLRKRNRRIDEIRAKAISESAESVCKRIEQNEREEKQTRSKGTSESTDNSRKRNEPSEPHDVETRPLKRPKINLLRCPRYHSKNAPDSGGDDNQVAEGGNKNGATQSVLLNLSPGFAFEPNCTRFTPCPQTAPADQTTFYTRQRESSAQPGQDLGEDGPGGGGSKRHRGDNANESSRPSRSLGPTGTREWSRVSDELGFTRPTPGKDNEITYNAKPPEPVQSERGVVDNADSAAEDPKDSVRTDEADVASREGAGDSNARSSLTSPAPNVPCPEEKLSACCEDKFDGSTPDYYADLGIVTTHGVEKRYCPQGIENIYKAELILLKWRHGGPERIRRLEKAYEVLRDPVRRAAYDAFLQEKSREVRENNDGSRPLLKRIWEYFTSYPQTAPADRTSFEINQPEDSTESLEDPGKSEYKSCDSEYDGGSNAIAFSADEYWNVNYTPQPPENFRKTGTGPRPLRLYNRRFFRARGVRGSAFPYSTSQSGWRALARTRGCRSPTTPFSQRRAPNTDDANPSEPILREAGAMHDVALPGTDVPQPGWPRSAPEPVGDEQKMSPRTQKPLDQITGEWIRTSPLSEAGAIPPPKKDEAASVGGGPLGVSSPDDGIPVADSSPARQQALHGQSASKPLPSQSSFGCERNLRSASQEGVATENRKEMSSEDSTVGPIQGIGKTRGARSSSAVVTDRCDEVPVIAGPIPEIPSRSPSARDASEMQLNELDAQGATHRDPSLCSETGQKEALGESVTRSERADGLSSNDPSTDVKEVVRDEPAPATPIQSENQEMKGKSDTTSRSGHCRTPPNGNVQSKPDKPPGYTPLSAGRNSGMGFPTDPETGQDEVNPEDYALQSGSCRLEGKYRCKSNADAEVTQEVAASPVLDREAPPLNPVMKVATPEQESSTPIRLEKVALPVQVEVAASPSRVENSPALIPNEEAAISSPVTTLSIPDEEAVTPIATGKAGAPTLKHKATISSPDQKAATHIPEQKSPALSPVTKVPALSSDKEAASPILVPSLNPTEESPKPILKEEAAPLITANKAPLPIIQQEDPTKSEQEAPTTRSQKKNVPNKKSKKNASPLSETNSLPTSASTYIPRTNGNNVVITWHGGDKFSTRTASVPELIGGGIRSIRDLDNDLEKKRDFWGERFRGIEGIYKEYVRPYKGLICALFFVNKIQKVRLLSRAQLERILGRPYARFLTTPITTVDRQASMEVRLKVLAMLLARDYPEHLLDQKGMELREIFNPRELESFKTGIPGGQVFDLLLR